MSSLVRTKVVSLEPVGLTDMKTFLRLPLAAGSDDTMIQGLIRAARIEAETITNCALVRSTFTQYMDHFPSHRIRERGYYGDFGNRGLDDGQGHGHHGEIKLKRPPLVSVQSLVYIGTDGRAYTLSPGMDFVVDAAQQPARIRPIPYTVWPLSLHTPNAVAINFTAGYAPNTEGVSGGQTAISEPETITESQNVTWQPGKTILQYSFLFDNVGNIWIETASPNGVTGSTRPTFESSAIGATIGSDGTAAWLNVGPLRGFWTPDTQYAGQNIWVLLDSNSNLQLLTVAALTSQTSPPSSVVGSTPPAWSSVLGALTTDNGVAAWRCLGNYKALGNAYSGVPSPVNTPEQQAAYTIDWTLPDTVPIAIMQLVTHWYLNREPVASGTTSEVPMHVRDLLASVTIHDFNPTQG